MLRIALCDDNHGDVVIITKLIKEWGAGKKAKEIRIKSFAAPYALLDAVWRGENFDIFLLDILLPEMTGIRLGERLKQILPKPLLIFLTSSEDYYPDAFRLYAFQYICKPAHPEALFPVLDKALSCCEKRKTDVFLLKTADGIARIPFQSIVYVELLAHICHFHLSNGECMESLYLRTSLDNFIEPLLRQKRFVKSHSSFVVNLDFTSKLTANSLLLTTGASVPVTRTFAAGVRQSYFSYGLREGE